MFESLRRSIEVAIARPRLSGSGRVSRGFVVSCGVDGKEIRGFLRSGLFTDQPGARPLRHWLVVDDPDSFQVEVDDAIREAFDVSVAERLMRDELSIVDTVNLAIFLVDACSPEAIEKAKMAATIFKDSFRGLVGSGSPLYLVGLFLVGRPVTPASDSSRQSEGFIRASLDGLRSVKEFTKRALNRAFLLDVSNPQQLLTVNPNDQHSLVAHLVYYLLSRSTTEDVEDFVQWLAGTEAQSGLIGGMSAYSVVLPLEEIIEVVTLSKGATVVKAALFEPVDATRFTLYVNAYLAAEQLITSQEIRERISPAESSMDPLEALDELFVDDYPTLDDVATARGISRSLKDLSDGFFQRVRKGSEARVRESAVSLEDHLEELIAQEFGGLGMAGKCLDSVASHLQDVFVFPEMRLPENSDRALNILESQVKRAPRRHAVFARGALLSAVAGAAVLEFSIPFAWHIVAIVGTITGPILLAAFAAHAIRERFRSLTVDVDHAIRARWHYLIESGWAGIVQSHVSELLEEVNRLRAEVQRAEERSRELIHFFRESYEPASKPSSTFLNRAVQERGDILEFGDSCRVTPAELADELVGDDRPFRLWRRLASAGVERPDGWEARVFERAAIRVLARCPELTQVNIISYMEKRDQLAGCRSAMLRCAQPFLKVTPGAHAGDPFGVLETANHPWVAELETSLRAQFERLETVYLVPPLRLSFLGFHEGISVDDVRP